ncbi:MAG: hypothetical protein DDT40_00835 [candidate division WS2 bacterium]|nr:hypothetical protein [Candidatus Psychracetigena formicireducens]
MPDVTIPPCVMDYLSTTTEGNRNDHLFKAVCSIKDLNKQISHQDLISEAERLNTLFGENNALPPHEIKAIVKSVWSKGYPASCKNFEDHCPGKKHCILYQHERKPIDFTSETFLDGRYMVSGWKKGNDYLYVLYDRGRKKDDFKRLTQDYTTPKKPLDLPPNTPFMSRIKSVLKDEFAAKKVDAKLTEIMEKLEKKINSDEDVELELQNQRKIEEAERLQEGLEQGKRLIKTLSHPLQYVGCVSDWVAAGERVNVLFGWLCGVHLIVYGQPINFIAVGKSGEGKSVIQSTAKLLLPQEHIIMEKKPTTAPMFRREPDFYDRKIVDYGDLGGKRDIEESEEARNILKELNSEGYVNKPVSFKQKGEDWDVKELELFGRPALWYTTVHETKVDEQEASRGFVISPRTDNSPMVMRRDEVLELGGKTKYILEQVQRDDVPAIQNMVRHLKDLEDLDIINPYMPVLKKWINDSPFIKRDYKKIIRLVHIITLINYKRRDMWVDEYRRYLITHPEDIILLYQILREYMMSIALNIPKSLIEFYSKLKKAGKDDKLDVNFTINDVREVVDVKDTSNLSQTLTRLRDVRLLDVVKDVRDEEGRVVNRNVNTYKMGGMKMVKIDIGEFVISKFTRDMLRREHNPGLLDFLDMQLMNIKNELDVHIHEWVMPNNMPPDWEWAEVRGSIREVKLKGYLSENGVEEGVEVVDEIVKEVVNEFEAFL